MSEGLSHHDTGNKPVALLIAVLALVLAFAEAGVNNSRNMSIAQNIEASNLWAFFQAKTIRSTVLKTAAEEMEVAVATSSDPKALEAMKKRIDAWQATAKRYDSEPETGEGRKELAEKAKKAEATRDLEHVRFEIYETASHMLQVAIVLASAMIITGIGALVWISGGLGLLGVVLMGFARFAPYALPFFAH